MALNSYAQHSYFTALYVANFQDPNPGELDSLIGVVEIPFVRNLDMPDGNFTPTNVTHLKSHGKYKEYIPGFGDPGEVSFTALYSEALAAQLGQLMPTALATPPAWGRFCWVAVWPDGSRAHWNGYINGVPRAVPEDGEILMECKIKISGGIYREDVTP